MAPSVMYGLRLFFLNKNYIVYRIVYMLVSFDIQVSITSPSFVALHLLISGIVVACGCSVLQELHCLAYICV